MHLVQESDTERPQQVTYYVLPSLRAIIKRIAIAEERSESQVATQLIREALKARGEAE